LASQGGVCSVINNSCCSYRDQSGRIETNLEEIWKQVRVLHEMAKDDTSWGFKEIWKKLTSWLPNLSWLRQLFVGILMLIIIILITCGMVKCFFLVLQTMMNYEEWKRKKIKHQVETGKYFRKL
ncbi:ERVV2 protein, partial [Probosciger aterrimus]|nr:ERVV2 protein [Probosciger aterrimus]